MSSRFWLQQQAKSGNWWDSIGSTKEECIRHGKWLAETRGEKVRVVERTDVVVWEGPNEQA